MRKFFINRGTTEKVEPTEQQINRHKNFGNFYHEYERLTKRGKKPIYQDPKLYLLIVLIGIILFLILAEGKY
jgi:hypothetical protein